MGVAQLKRIFVSTLSRSALAAGCVVFRSTAIRRKTKAKAKDPIMEWPHRFLHVVFALGAAAILVPWLIPRIRFASWIRLVPFVAAMGCWISYELHLHSIARPGDPLIRVDLMLILPLLLIAFLSTYESILVKRRHRPKSQQDTVVDRK